MTSLQTLLARRRPGYTLEAPFYTDAAILAKDIELIFGRHWVYVGVEPDIPEAGDCMTVDIGPHAIIVARDDDMGLHAFHNVCRHRGARLLEVEKSNVGNIVCPYHQWTYGLDGALKFAAHMPKDFDRTCHGLRPVHVRSLAGLLFVCLADTPPDDFDAMAEMLTPYVAPHDIASCKIAYAEDIIEQGNWKLVMENNRECYHCTAAHPELTIPLYEYGFGTDPASVDPEQAEMAADYQQAERRFAEIWSACALPYAEIERLDDITAFRTQRLPIADAGESHTMTTGAASRRLLGNFTSARMGGLSFWTAPNSWHHFMADHAVTFCVLPLGPEETLVRTKWLVAKDAEEGRDYDIDTLTEVWRATNDQDRALVERAAAGVRSSAYEPGPYSPVTETMVEKFTAWYIARLKSAA